MPPWVQTQSVRAAPARLLQVDSAALLVGSRGGRRGVLAFPAVTLTGSLRLEKQEDTEQRKVKTKGKGSSEDPPGSTGHGCHCFILPPI